MNINMEGRIIDEKKIEAVLAATRSPSSQVILKILKKAREKKGLELKEAGYLINLKEKALREELFVAAGWVKNEIYGERLVFFAPLYISNYCINDCEYCNFHTVNNQLQRKKLTLKEIEEQVKVLIDMGHKRVLLECGEDPKRNNIEYVVEAIKRIYSVRTNKGNIRRVNVNIAATTVSNYRKLKKANIGTYQLFQETYHRLTYSRLHSGPKADYERQLTAHSRAHAADLDDLGIGALFGLYDWRFEVLALISHAQYLDRILKVGPHTISVPRFQAAPTVIFKPQYSVSDNDFLKLIAILRIAVPYTGIIISTRESPLIRKRAFQIGVSQASAGSCVTIGGYGRKDSQPQFKIHDSRPLEEVIKQVVSDGFLPSFCTACYRRGRTGKEFMELSKGGEIHKFCRANAILTFAEYLEDFSANGLREQGRALLKVYLEKIENLYLRQETQKRLLKISSGRRDLYF
ncbi:MAG: [FeFe] hydrogenase H-cluster radical SAM maturase HydG [Candidatus Omnitrophota bacterium]|nr:[FeFe] hydrogenase H-cluster radical SAM maturase HydG [Candidatus Omnitrophota bacterium]